MRNEEGKSGGELSNSRASARLCAMPVSHSPLRDRPAEHGSTHKLTARGGFLLAASLLAVVGGFLFPEPQAVQVGLMGMVILVVSWPLARMNLRAITGSRTVPESAFAGQPFPVEITVKNGRSRWDAMSIDYEDGIAGPAERGLHVAWLRPGGSSSRQFKTRLLRRGLRHRLRSSVQSSFPLGLWRVREEFVETIDMVLIPRPIVPRLLDDPEFSALLEADESESIQVDHSGDFHGLREFQPGDRVKQIDWPATARAQKLLVRKFDRRLPSRFLIVFHSITPGRKAHHGETFDSAMELLCGLLLGLNHRGIPMDLMASFNGWKQEPVGGDERRLANGLRILAGARRAPESDFRMLLPLLAALDSSQRVFILSDVPVKWWEPELPEVPCLVTCLSVSEMRVRQPRIFQRS